MSRTGLTLSGSGPPLVPRDLSSVLPYRKLLINWVLILCTRIFRIRSVTQCAVSVLLIEKSGANPWDHGALSTADPSATFRRFYRKTDTSTHLCKYVNCLFETYSSKLYPYGVVFRLLNLAGFPIWVLLFDLDFWVVLEILTPLVENILSRSLHHANERVLTCDQYVSKVYPMAWTCPQGMGTGVPLKSHRCPYMIPKFRC